MTKRQGKLDLNHLNIDISKLNINFFHFHLNISTAKKRERERKRKEDIFLTSEAFRVQNVIIYNSLKFQLSEFTDTLNTETCSE